MKYPITVKIEVFRQKHSFQKAGSNWDWRMVYRNNRIGGGSTEGYRNRLYCLQNLAVVTGIDVRPYVKKAKPFKAYVRLTATPSGQARIWTLEKQVEYLP
jgi:hypothetical protein